MPGPTTCTFGNTTLSLGFDAYFGPGIQPSIFLLNTVPHAPNLPNVGELRFQTAGEAPFVFRDCLLEDPRLIVGEQGKFWQLPVKDRRWMWQWGSIDGRYNVPKPDGTLLRETTPRALAAKLLDAMGEPGYDVSRLPNDPRPETNWEGSVPAIELDRLCASLGCVVVLNWITDRVEIWPLGVGGTLPTGFTRGTNYAPVYPAQPQRVRIEAGYTLFQALFRLEAVGLDTDGRWKPIDSLSYRPASGWVFWPGLEYSEQLIPGTYTSGGRTLKRVDLANGTVYYCYRITGLANGGWAVPLLSGTPLAPQSLKDFRLFDELADEEISTVDGGLRPLPSVVYARYFRENKAFPTSQIRYEHGFSFDTQHGILMFPEPLFLLNPVRPAEVRLECAFHAGRDGLFHRHSVEATTGSSIVTPTRLIQQNDITARVVYRYSADNTFTTSSNLTDTTSRLNYWKDAALAEYGLRNGGTVNYQKLMAISPDGLTLQISWSGGRLRTPRTVVSQAQRHNRYVKPLNELRDRLIAKQNERLLQNLAHNRAIQAIAGRAV